MKWINFYDFPLRYILTTELHCIEVLHWVCRKVRYNLRMSKKSRMRPRIRWEDALRMDSQQLLQSGLGREKQKTEERRWRLKEATTQKELWRRGLWLIDLFIYWMNEWVNEWVNDWLNVKFDCIWSIVSI